MAILSLTQFENDVCSFSFFMQISVFMYEPEISVLFCEMWSIQWFLNFHNRLKLLKNKLDLFNTTGIILESWNSIEDFRKSSL